MLFIPPHCMCRFVYVVDIMFFMKSENLKQQQNQTTVNIHRLPSSDPLLLPITVSQLHQENIFLRIFPSTLLHSLLQTLLLTFSFTLCPHVED